MELKRTMTKLFFYLTIGLRPSYWFMITEYNREWDTKFQDLLSKHEFDVDSSYEAILGGYVLWIENRPYGCFNHYLKLNERISCRVRPSRYALYLGMKKLNKAMKVLKIQAEKNIKP